jgi:hypothetical protein
MLRGMATQAAPLVFGISVVYRTFVDPDGYRIELFQAPA